MQPADESWHLKQRGQKGHYNYDLPGQGEFAIGWGNCTDAYINKPNYKNTTSYSYCRCLRYEIMIGLMVFFTTVLSLLSSLPTLDPAHTGESHASTALFSEALPYMKSYFR